MLMGAELLTRLRRLAGDIIWNDWSTQLDSKLAWSKSRHKACWTDGLKILYYKNCNDIKGINQSHMKSSVKDLIGCSVMGSFYFIHVCENATKSFWKNRLLEFKIRIFKTQAFTSKIVRSPCTSCLFALRVNS